jgi:hypothetical protein
MSVNHNYNFKDPETGAHTNKIEGLWSQFKRMFKAMNGCNRAQLQSYINEFMWRHWNDVNRVEAFEFILDEIGKYYPADDLAKLVKLQDDPEDENSFTEWMEQNEKDGTWREEDSEAGEFERENVEGEETTESKREENEGDENEREENETEESIKKLIKS